MVLDALYENHPSFFANEDEFAQVKAELRMAEQFSRANETSKLNVSNSQDDFLYFIQVLV